MIKSLPYFFLFQGLASAAASASSASTSRASASKFNKPHILDNVERRANALAILRLICESPVFLHQLEAILASRDAQGNLFIPFFQRLFLLCLSLILELSM